MRPTLADLKATTRVVTLPMRTKFRGIQERELLLFEGSQGWAEFSPFVEYEIEEAATWLSAAIDWAFNEQPEKIRQLVPVNATLPAVGPSEVDQVLAKFGTFETVKIKVAEAGQTIVDDLARIITVKAAYPTAKVRLDANGALSVDQALALTAAVLNADVKLDYFEQPCATIAELAQLRERFAAEGLQAKIAADESVRKASDPLAVAQAGAADVLVLKAAPLGGVRQALSIADQAGLPAVVSSALESSVGLAMGLHLAACIPDLEYDCGLATAALLEVDVTDEPLLAIDGKINVRRVEPAAQLLERYQAEAEVAEWWLERLEDCYELLKNKETP